ncbi:hypothetical protein ACFL1M_02670 [Patescibacteria group bacterium]
MFQAAALYIVSFIILVQITRLSRRAFISISYLLFHSKKIGIIIYSMIYLPGTIIHELSHFFTAAFLGVRTGEISIFPREEEDSRIQLGSVKIAKTDFFRSSLIGVAPFIVGNILLFYFVSVLGIDITRIGELLKADMGIQKSIFLYLTLAVSNTLFTSKEDRSHWPVLMGFMLVCFIVFWAIGISINIPSSFALKIINVINGVAWAVSFSILINIFIYLVLTTMQKIIEKITKQKVTYK